MMKAFMLALALTCAGAAGLLSPILHNGTQLKLSRTRREHLQRLLEKQ